MLREYLNPLTLLKSLALFLACFMGSEAALALYAPPAVFPMNAGLALAGLVIGGFELAPAVFIAALVSYLMHGSSLIIAIALGLGNALQALVGAYILKTLRFDPLLRRMRDIFALAAVAVGASTVVPTVVLFAFSFVERMGGTAAPISWSSYWVGDMWALLIVAPLVIRWLAKPLFKRSLNQVLETIAAFGLLTLADYMVFWSASPTIGGVSLVYFMLVPFFWIALRLSPRFLTFALAMTSAFAFYGSLAGPASRLATIPLGQRFYSLQIFIVVIALIFYILESIAAERRYAIDALRVQVNNLEQALRRISEDDRAKTEFISILAHELRNPLAPIMSGLEILALDVDKQERTRIVDMMSGRVSVMRRLLDDLLDISRVSRNKLTLQKEPVDVTQLLQSSVNAVNELTVQKSHGYTLEIPAEPLIVNGDPVRIEQIFVNLLKNAVKYTPQGGHVTISCGRQGECAEVHFKDNGIGIEKTMLEKIFEPFIQGSTAAAERGGTGLGIGLSITKHLTEMHEGSIEVQSAGKGKGSEFIVRLPLTSLAPSTPSVMQESVAKQQEALRLLVVDDNVTAAESIGRLLQHKGHQVELALSGVDALAKAKEFKPDIVLLDIGLPDVSGYEVARTLRTAQQYGGTLVALTGYGQEDDKNRAYDSGFDYHLTKPVPIKDIERVLARR